MDEADAADPNQAATINLRGEILLAQKDFDGAETAFKQALKTRSETLAKRNTTLRKSRSRKRNTRKRASVSKRSLTPRPAPGGDKNQAAQIIKFKIYLTLLLEGKDSRAQKMMEQFQFTGDTPALYYAQAAWEFKHNNTPKANDWIVSARKIYSPALNLVFADSFYDLGWLQKQAAAPVVASTEVAKTDAPSIEPSPIPAVGVDQDGQATNRNRRASSHDFRGAYREKRQRCDRAGVVAKSGDADSFERIALRNPRPAPARARANPCHGTGRINRSRAARRRARQSQANAPVDKTAPDVAATTTATTPATVLAPATVREWSVSRSAEGSIQRLTRRWPPFGRCCYYRMGRCLRDPAAAREYSGLSFSRTGDRATLRCARARDAGAENCRGRPPRWWTAAGLAPTESFGAIGSARGCSVRQDEPPVWRRQRNNYRAGNGAVVENFIPREKVPVHEPEPEPRRRGKCLRAFSSR